MDNRMNQKQESKEITRPLDGASIMILYFHQVFLLSGLSPPTKQEGYCATASDFSPLAQLLLDHSEARPLLTFRGYNYCLHYCLRAGILQLLEAARENNVTVILTGLLPSWAWMGVKLLAELCKVNISLESHERIDRLITKSPSTVLIVGDVMEHVTSVPLRPVLDRAGQFFEWITIGGVQEHLALSLQNVKPVGFDTFYETVSMALTLSVACMPNDLHKIILGFVGNNRLHAMCSGLVAMDRPIVSDARCIVAKCYDCKRWNLVTVAKQETSRRQRKRGIAFRYVGVCTDCDRVWPFRDRDLALVQSFENK